MGANNQREAWEHESNWLSAAIASAVILGGCLIFVADWILTAPTEKDSLVRVQIAAPFGVLAVAAITFFTVVWRGLISARQADTSLRQFEGLSKQIAIAEETGLATLLQKGSELLADSDDAKRSAGIATLEAAAISDTAKFSAPARRLLIEFVRTKGHYGHAGRAISQAVASVNAVFRKHRTLLLDEHMSFEYNDEWGNNDEYVTGWEIVEGIGFVDYRGGEMLAQTTIKDNLGQITFNSVYFVDCDIDDFSYYRFNNRCTFQRCRFGKIHTSDLSRFSFNDCEFTGTKIVFDLVMPDLREGKNGFIQDQPPTADGNTGPQIDWEDVFLVWSEDGSAGE